MDTQPPSPLRFPYHICIEGIDGIGKTTLLHSLKAYFEERGKKVFVTKEPGIMEVPVTMELRKIMLDKAYDSQLPPLAREYIAQAIRVASISYLHEHILYTSSNQADGYDIILQDRGLLSGISYALAMGISSNDVLNLLDMTTNPKQYKQPQDYKVTPIPYDMIVHLSPSDEEGVALALMRARTAKKEFQQGDVMESKSIEFTKQVDSNFKNWRRVLKDKSKKALNLVEITIDPKSSSRLVFESTLLAIRKDLISNHVLPAPQCQ